MLPRAVKELVAYTPGTAFFADGSGRGHLRLAFCYPPPAEVRDTPGNAACDGTSPGSDPEC